MHILNFEKLSRIYYQKFFKKLAEDVQDIKEYLASTPQETGKLLSLYQLRNDSHREQKGVDNPHFTKIISLLKTCKESNLVMHILKVKDQLLMILTDTNYTHVVGEL